MQQRDLKPGGNVRNDYTHSDDRRGVARFPAAVSGKSAACRIRTLVSTGRSADLYSHFPPPATTKTREFAVLMRNVTRAVSRFYSVRISDISRIPLFFFFFSFYFYKELHKATDLSQTLFQIFVY